MRVLLVSPDSGLAQGLLAALAEHGHQLEVRHTLSSALLSPAPDPPLIVFDLADGSSARWKRLALGLHSLDTPHIVVGAFQQELDDPVRALQMGADDYVARPVSLTELAMRVERVDRRAAPRGEGSRTRSRSKSLALDPNKRLVELRGRQARLGPTEFRLLQALVANEGQLTPRRDLVGLLAATNKAASDRILNCYIWSLRRKLEQAAPQAQLIVTRRGLGYVLRQGR